MDEIEIIMGTLFSACSSDKPSPQLAAKLREVLVATVMLMPVLQDLEEMVDRTAADDQITNGLCIFSEDESSTEHVVIKRGDMFRQSVIVPVLQGKLLPLLRKIDNFEVEFKALSWRQREATIAEIRSSCRQELDYIRASAIEAPTCVTTLKDVLFTNCNHCFRKIFALFQTQTETVTGDNNNETILAVMSQLHFLYEHFPLASTVGSLDFERAMVQSVAHEAVLEELHSGFGCMYVSK